VSDLKPSDVRYFDTNKPRLFAHRGASGEYPENTLTAFRHGIEQGAELLELDVHATREGTVVVIHDEELSRTTSGRGLVRDTSFETLRSLDAGACFGAADGSRPHAGRGIVVPTLKEVLEEFPDVPLNVEIKQEAPGIERNVVELLESYDARGRVVLAAERHAVMERIRAMAPDWATGFSAEEVVEFHDRVSRNDFTGYEPLGCALQVPHFYGDIEVVTTAFVSAAHALGLEVHVWTINDEAEMRELLALGVDALMSDFPSRVARLLEH
jgi:glycerophosphoryl diester phosphodiesterase